METFVRRGFEFKKKKKNQNKKILLSEERLFDGKQIFRKGLKGKQGEIFICSSYIRCAHRIYVELFSNLLHCFL